MMFTGSRPVGAIAPPDADVLTPGRSNAVHGRAPEPTPDQPSHDQAPQDQAAQDQAAHDQASHRRLSHDELANYGHDLPPGLVEALLRAPAVEPDRLDRARLWLRQHREDLAEVPTCDELADCILQDAVELAVL